MRLATECRYPAWLVRGHRETHAAASIFDERGAQSVALLTSLQFCTSGAEQIDWQPRQHSMPDIQCLRDDIERERDETLVDGAGFPSVLKSARQQLIANTAALLTALGS